jgi:hypothetical protein
LSIYQGIGGVSISLRDLLRDRMVRPPSIPPATQIGFSIGIPPDEREQQPEGPQINLFLYRITENPYLKNQEIPGVGSPAAYGHPPLSVDLHYLLTAYGASGRLDEPQIIDEQLAHFLMGDAMHVLHEFPVVTPDLVTSGGSPILHESLRNEFEQIKVTLEPLSIEDISKIWTALNRPMRVSSAYSVSVVQIESERPRRYPRPVGEPPHAGPRIATVGGRSPIIDDVQVSGRSGPYARVGDVLVIRGSGFETDLPGLRLGPFDATGSITAVLSDRVTAVVPDDPTLLPGPRAVVFTKSVLLGEPPSTRVAFESNQGVFVLVPHVESVSLNAAAASPTVDIIGTRLFAPNLDGQTLVGDVVIPASDYTTAASTHVTFPLPGGIGSGVYPVRVRVNAAESVDIPTVTVP